MTDDYLWDRSGTEDPDVARLERLLSPLRHGSRQLPPLVHSATRASYSALPLVAAVLLAAVATLVWHVYTTAPTQGWAVSRVSGSPTVALRPIDDRDELRVGSALQTGAGSRAQLEVPEIGYVDVGPRSRVELLRSSDTHHRLRLSYGTLHAFIVAPPGRFVVDTSSATAVDLGCAYTLRVDERGAGSVHVTSGWVGFEWEGRESFIPAGAMCETRPRVGPGTPHVEDVSPAFRQALRVLDFAAPAAPQRSAALTLILEQARPADAVTLWHLLARVGAADRQRVYRRLAAIVPPPAEVTEAGVLAGDRAMLDRWWGELGFGDITTWRTWKQQWNDEDAR